MKYCIRSLPIYLSLLSLCACSSGGASLPRSDDGSRGPAMVVTANPLASKAGAEVLAAGGSAVDAAVAIQAVLSLVEPQSSGLGGGGFLVYFENETNAITSYDGRETAPASAQVDRFLLPSGEKMGYLDAKHSGLSTGVPGMVAMLDMAHRDHGSLPWSSLFDAAQQHARNGFEVSPRLHGMIQRFGKYLPKTTEEGPTDAWDYFHLDDGQPLPIGYVLKNLDYANALSLIAEDPKNFYRGELAEQIVEAVNQPPRAGGMSLDDIAAYSPEKQAALCAPFRAAKLCGPPPPSSWLAVAMIMGIVENADAFTKAGASDPANWAVFGEAQRLAYADRDRFVADSRQVIVPVSGMLHPDYLALRASQLSSEQAAKNVKPGDPWSYSNELPSALLGEDQTHDVAGTTHFVVVDHDGNVVSMTASVESIFGSARMVGGLFLNNQLTDFSFQPVDADGQPIANAVAGGKRPRSSMSPTILVDGDGEFKMATGSPGGNSIIAYTAKTLVGVLEWGLSPQEAIDLPNLVGRGDVVRIEKERASTDLIQGLRDYGFEVKESAGENSGLSVVYVTPAGALQGGVDPRREGTIEIVF